MDLQLKQWRSLQQNESEEEQPSATKMSNFYFDEIQSQTPTSAALPLFEPTSSSASSKLSSFSCFSPDSSSSSSLSSFRLPKMGNFFSWAQWQELELQALIYRYMLAGAAVPQELLLPIKKSLIHRSPSHFLQHPLHHFPHHQPAWYWGRGAMDPEPGRCKRTDGKKWRCSRDVVAGHKYCERHIHRGRNRSRKPVEIPTPNPNSNPNSTITATATSRAIAEQLDTACGGHGATLHSSSDQLLHLSQSYSEMKQESNNNKRSYEFSNGGSDDGHTLRHFFDDWPRSSDSTSSSRSSATCLSISMPENVSSDVSLKLSTGNEEEEEELRNSNGREQQNMMSWWSNGGNQQQQMGGPLAEALRSASSSSPTSVLRRLGISTQVFN